MKHAFKAIITAPFLMVGMAHAMPCDGIDLSLREAVQEVLTNAESPRISGWAKYLNDSFYTDVSCKLSYGMNAEDVLRLRGEPEVLLDLVMGTYVNRNQSDALMLMLSAMKDGSGEKS
ncbi:hypothetical protein G5B38_08975 [Pseudohalocynthiibacter aestuariivivens]|uniref:HdeA/HdeB family protein n=1 Tax=Roseovarius pelagicus TaxID=2980108 RepID=A0ABY6D981_9RHOB|nr:MULTISPECIES: hypothetical protein [Rhodobacterales]QIE45648.1 hypothetical protein G5B38_08975 [Pseudohalocynthiibacter aestuariivivens]UXX82434.1 hypothetical protein N7U68_15215 [Roseovarius pelagicus]